MYAKLLLYALLVGSPQFVHAQYRQSHAKPRPKPQLGPLPTLSFKTIQDEPFRSTPMLVDAVVDSIKLLSNLDSLRYPAIALRQGVEGMVVLRLLIAPDGHVEDAAFERLDPVLYNVKLKRHTITGRGAGTEQLRKEGVRALAVNAIAFWRKAHFTPRKTAYVIQKFSHFMTM